MAVPSALLGVSLTGTPGVAHAGGKYAMDVWISTNDVDATNVELTVSGTHATVTCDATKNRTRSYPSVVSGNPRDVPITVSVPSSFTKGTVTVKAHVEADNAGNQDASTSFTVTKAPSNSSSGSSGGSSDSTGSGGSSGSNSSGGSNSSSSSNGSSGSGGSSAPNSGGSAPNPMGSLNGATPNPTASAMLPNVAQPPSGSGSAAQNPAIANAGNERDLRATGAEPDGLTFNKLASTQAAWLAVLLVVFSLLLTQVRLGKVSLRPERFKGAHRKTRRPRAH